MKINYKDKFGQWHLSIISVSEIEIEVNNEVEMKQNNGVLTIKEIDKYEKSTLD